MHPRILPALLILPLLTKSATASLITFDEFGSTNAIPTPIPDGYATLNWSNFYVKSAGDLTDPQHNVGYGHGVVSGTDIAYNGNADPATISSPLTTPFTLISVYLTAAWNDDLNVTIEATGTGGKNATEFQQTVTLNTLAPTLVTLNFTNIHTVTFSSSGGTPHDPDAPDGLQFVMDNLTITNLPEPTTATLLILALPLLVHPRKHRH
jgi:hypothetical protein